MLLLKSKKMKVWHFDEKMNNNTIDRLMPTSHYYEATVKKERKKNLISANYMSCTILFLINEK